MKTGRILSILRRPRLLYHQALRTLQASRKVIIIGSAHKVGSTWIFDLLKDLCALRTLPLPEGVRRAHLTGQAVNIDIVEILTKMQIPDGWYIHKSHSYPPPADFAAQLDKRVNFVTVIRDPRDVIVSASFYLARLSPDRGGWGEDFSNLSQVAKMLLIMRKGEFLVSRLQEWSNFPFAYKARYEDLLHDGVGETIKILNFLEIRASLKEIDYFCEKHSFEKRTGRKVGVEDQNAFLRKGISGDWMNYFTDECKATFKVSQNGEWNRLLLALGYERHLDW